MSIWKKNKAKAVYRNTDPTLTDQSGARDTDINVIVGQFLKHGQVMGGAKKPMFGQDYSELPRDLRGFIEMGKDLETHRRNLPEQLQGIKTQDLLALTPEQLKNILTPPQPVAPKEEPK